MARYKTKKQKIKTTQKVQVLETVSGTEPKTQLLEPVKSQTTFFSQTQVKLLYKDLLKTFLVTMVVFIVLLSIIVFMR